MSDSKSSYEHAPTNAADSSASPETEEGAREELEKLKKHMHAQQQELGAMQNMHKEMEMMKTYNLQELVAVAGKNPMPPEFKGEVDAALLLSSAQAALLAQTNPANILKELGLKSLPRVVINLVGDVTLEHFRVSDVTSNSFQEMVGAKERLIDFMKEVVIPYASQNRALILCDANKRSILNTCFHHALLSQYNPEEMYEFGVLGFHSTIREENETKKKSFKKKGQKKTFPKNLKNLIPFRNLVLVSDADADSAEESCRTLLFSLIEDLCDKAPNVFLQTGQSTTVPEKLHASLALVRWAATEGHLVILLDNFVSKKASLIRDKMQMVCLMAKAQQSGSIVEIIREWKKHKVVISRQARAKTNPGNKNERAKKFPRRMRTIQLSETGASTGAHWRASIQTAVNTPLLPDREEDESKSESVHIYDNGTDGDESKIDKWDEERDEIYAQLLSILSVDLAKAMAPGYTMREQELDDVIAQLDNLCQMLKSGVERLAPDLAKGDFVAREQELRDGLSDHDQVAVQDMWDMDLLAYAWWLIKVEMINLHWDVKRDNAHLKLWQEIQIGVYRTRNTGNEGHLFLQEHDAMCQAILSFARCIFLHSKHKHNAPWMFKYISQATSLLNQDNVYALSVSSQLSQAKQLLRTRAKLPRLPTQHTLQGLKLLRDCWDHYDVLMSVSIQSKNCSRFFLAMMTILNALVVSLTAVLFQYYNLEALLLASNATGTPTLPPGTPTSLDFEFIQDWGAHSILKLILLLATLSQTFFIALYRFYDPEQKWRVQRAMAMRMDRIVWTYRTYTGPFAEINLPPGQLADDVLENQLEKFVDGMVKQLESTKVMTRHRSTIFRHGQHAQSHEQRDAATLSREMLQKQVKRALARAGRRRNKGRWNAMAQRETTEQNREFGDQPMLDMVERTRNACYCCGPSYYVVDVDIDVGTGHSENLDIVEDDEADPKDAGSRGAEDDDEYSPISPAGYLKYRIGEKLKFYQQRIPKYHCCQQFFALSTACLSFASTACAVFFFPPSSAFWLAITATILTAFMAFSKHYDPDSKLRRYNNTASELKKLVSFWQGLTVLQQNQLHNINHLVSEGEKIIFDEVSSWGVSTSRSLEAKNKNHDKDDNPGTDKKKNKRVKHGRNSDLSSPLLQ